MYGLLCIVQYFITIHVFEESGVLLAAGMAALLLLQGRFISNKSVQRPAAVALIRPRPLLRGVGKPNFDLFACGCWAEPRGNLSWATKDFATGQILTNSSSDTFKTKSFLISKSSDLSAKV